MRETKPSGYVRYAPDASMPLPDGDVEWQLRYGNPPTVAARMKAASILAAYREMVEAAGPVRQQMVRAIRAAMMDSPEAPDAHP